MYTLKEIPEDFVVEEVSNIKTLEQGRYIYFVLEKKNMNTLDAIKKISYSLNLREKDIGFAGSKDKNAITSQICSVKCNKNKLLSLKLNNIKIIFFGYGNKPISLGDLTGNRFKITVRNLDNFSVKKNDFIVNYFDEQRFSANNSKIGRHFIKKQFKEAVKLIDNFRCKKHLENHPHDYVGALKKLPLRLLRLFVNAYQSYLWNETVAEYLIKSKIKEVSYSLGKFIFVNKHLDLQIPLIGFGSEELETPEINKIITKIMSKENLEYSDFVIKQIPELTLEGEMRSVMIKIKNLKVEPEKPDELNIGKKKIELSFELSKGSYATLVIKKLIDIKC